jgi:signal transduction histidine kinase
MSRKKRLLIIDDEFNLIKILRMNLQAEGYDVVTADDGVEGLAHIQSSPPDLIVCDLIMPRMDGLELCRRIREDRETDRIPFIFLSARAEMPEKLDGFRAGADDYVTKPFDINELIARIQAILNRVDRVREDGASAFRDTSQNLNRLSSLGILAASMAHEIRNQLATVVSSAELLRLNPSEITKNQYADVVFKRIEQVNHTISSMLKFASHREVRFESVAFSVILNDALELVRPRIVTAKVRVETDIPVSLPCLLADRHQIGQVLINLLINALDAVSGDGRIHIRASEAEEEPVIEVSDNGCGIPSSMIETVFQPFVTSKVNSGGIGLGLYIVKEIIEAHKGTILVESAEGRGTCFRICLPIDRTSSGIEKNAPKNL